VLLEYIGNKKVLVSEIYSTMSYSQCLSLSLKKTYEMSKTYILSNNLLLEPNLRFNTEIFGSPEQAFLLLQNKLRVLSIVQKFTQNMTLAFGEDRLTETLHTPWLCGNALIEYMPQKNALIRSITSLLSLPIFLSCQISSHANQYDNCNKRDREAFSSCMKKNFPVGSSYSDLKRYLTEQGFTQSKHPDHIKDNRFYFFWRANDLSNYQVAIMGRYNNEIKIVEIDIP
jgi:hypothetical protein